MDIYKDIGAYTSTLLHLFGDVLILHTLFII